jgi:hypothetical protein
MKLFGNLFSFMALHAQTRHEEIIFIYNCVYPQPSHSVSQAMKKGKKEVREGSKHCKSAKAAGKNLIQTSGIILLWHS